MGAKAGQRKGGAAAGQRRAGLFLFGTLFFVLFIGFAVGQGLGSPSVPSGDIVHVSDVPDEFANVSEEEFKRTFARLVTSEGGKAPKPGTEKYEEARDKAITELIEGIWIRGQAEELDIEVTGKQVEDELKTVKKQNFPTKDAYEKFLEESKFTQDEVDQLLELQIMVKEIQSQINSSAPKPSSDAIADYYDAEKDTQFTTKQSRDVRLIINKDKSKVEAAKKQLEADNSPASWKKVATQYSSDPTSKAKGGLQEGITEEFLQGPLKAAVFDSATGELAGPVDFQGNFVLVEVVKLNAEKVQTLDEAKTQIESTLAQEIQQETFAEFAADFETKWQQRTYCADDFTIEKCSNYESDGHPASASPACYETDPKAPAEECPAPVTPISPALPGTVTQVKPKGEPFPQRPRPENLEAAGEVPGGVPGEVPTEAVPPTGE